MQTNGYSPADDALLQQLKNLLLTEDRMLIARLEDDLQYLKTHFPENYERVVNGLIEEKIRNSKEELVEVIYPLLGSMVTKYIEHQFQMLKESIEARLHEMRERLSFWKRLKMRFSKVSEAELILAATDAPKVLEVFLVERFSGLLLAHAAKKENFDKEAVAGMLTAIKSFVEDAFQRPNEELDYIAYGSAKILVQNYPKYYIAALVEGSISANERYLLEQRLHDFILNEYNFTPENPDYFNFDRISRLLEERFFQIETKIQS